MSVQYPSTGRATLNPAGQTGWPLLGKEHEITLKRLYPCPHHLEYVVTEPTSDTKQYPTRPAVSIEHLYTVGEDTARVSITTKDGRRWHLDVQRSGDYEVVTSWDSEGDLADLDVPEHVQAELTKLR